MKRRKRSIRLGASAPEHRAEQNRYLSQAQSQISSLERRRGSCFSMFRDLTSIEHTMGKAAAHGVSKGAPLVSKSKRSKKAARRYGAAKQLSDRLEDLETYFEDHCMRD